MKTKTYNMRFLKFLSIALVGSFIISSCSEDVSSTTGWGFNNPKTGGFQKK